MKAWILFLIGQGMLWGGQPAPGRTAMVVCGRSMLPTLPETCRIVVVGIPFSEVRVGAVDGDIIATRLNGIPVIHRAVQRRPDGSVVTWGDNNARHDAPATTEQNYVGVVIGFEMPGQPGELVIPAPRHRSQPAG